MRSATLGLALASCLLAISIPWLLVRIDVIRADHLGLIPFMLAGIVAAYFVAVFIQSRRAKRGRHGGR
jgi:hypothetical protein